MIKPCLVRFNNKLYLMALTFQEGDIVDVNGPYRFEGIEGSTRKAFWDGLLQLVIAHRDDIVYSMDQLPEHLQKRFYDAENLAKTQDTSDPKAPDLAHQDVSR